MTSALLFTLFFAPAHADPGPRARAAYNSLDAKTYAGGVTNLGLGYRTPDRYDLGVNADLLVRSYRGGPTVNDEQFTAAVSSPLSDAAYVDVAGSFASTANIYARRGASVAPHYVVAGTDFGMGFRYAEYKLTNVGVLSPTAFHYFANGLTIGVGANVVRTDQNIASGTLTAIYTLAERHALRLGGGAGRTLEDAGLTAHFNVWSAEYAYTCAARFTVGAAFTDYWSQVRQEQTVTLRLGWR